MVANKLKSRSEREINLIIKIIDNILIYIENKNKVQGLC